MIRWTALRGKSKRRLLGNRLDGGKKYAGRRSTGGMRVTGRMSLVVQWAAHHGARKDAARSCVMSRAEVEFSEETLLVAARRSRSAT